MSSTLSADVTASMSGIYVGIQLHLFFSEQFLTYDCYKTRHSHNTQTQTLKLNCHSGVIKVEIYVAIR